MIKDIIQNVYSKHPLVHNIPNYVAVQRIVQYNIDNRCASPIMADEPHEVGEATQISDGLCFLKLRNNFRKSIYK